MPSPEPLVLHGLVGRSLAMRTLFERIKFVARLDMTVLIRGEPGTEKDLVAAAIHHLSRRSGRSFESIHCGEFAGELLPQYAETVATLSAWANALIAGDGGTLFLNCVDELSRQAQTLLTDLLDHAAIRPPGSLERTPVNARVIAATDHDLADAVRRGAFRQNLYYQLWAIKLVVPPLRARLEDLPLLVEQFRAEYAARLGVTVRGVTPEAVARLSAHEWPGNLAELQAVLAHAMVRQTGGWVQPRDLELPRLATIAAGGRDRTVSRRRRSRPMSPARGVPRRRSGLRPR